MKYTASEILIVLRRKLRQEGGPGFGELVSMKESLVSVTMRGLQAPSRPRVSKVEMGLASHPSVSVLAHTLFSSLTQQGLSPATPGTITQGPPTRT